MPGTAHTDHPESRSPSDRPYRLLQLASTTIIGGTERMILQLVERLDRGRFEPIVMSLVRGGAFIEECRNRGIEAEFLDARFPLDPRAWTRFCRVVRDRSIDLVHLYGLRANLPGRPLARLAGARSVVAGIRNVDPWRKWYHSLPDRLTARWVDRFVSNSEAGRIATIERERIDPERVVTIHSGIDERPDPEAFDLAELNRKFGIPKTASPVIAVIANLRAQKRHRDLIDAAVLLKERLPDLLLLCAGQDRMKGANQRHAHAQGVAERFRWLGHVPDVSEVIAASHFAALPSSFEGLPASILEVMAMGRTLIATPVGGVSEIVRDGENGLLVPVAEPATLADAIERLANDSELRARLEREALRTARDDFSVDRMVRETESLYLEVLASPVG